VAILALALGCGWFAAWYPHRTQNVFDAVMAEAWSTDLYYYPPPGFFDRWTPTSDADLYERPSRYTLSSKAAPGVTVEVRCRARYDSHGGRDGPASWVAGKFPVEMDMLLVTTPEDGVEVTYRALYTQSDRTLTLSGWVEYTTNSAEDRFGPPRGEEAIAALLGGEEEVERRALALVESHVLPDFLEINPSIKFTAERWGNVEVVVEDPALTGPPPEPWKALGDATRLLVPGS
jgi:hypothetical protein